MSCGGRGVSPFLTMSRYRYGFDRAQASSIYHAARSRSRPRKTPPTPQQWAEFLDNQIETLVLDDRLTDEQFTALYRTLNRLRVTPPDETGFAALKGYAERAEKAARARDRQIAFAAAINGHTEHDTQALLHALRDQHQATGNRSEVPAEWRSGFTNVDKMSMSIPQDRATLYAFYRLQNDPRIADLAATQRNWAAIDLETSGPPGREGFLPNNGCIIEAAVITYNDNGDETDRYSTLIASDPAVLAEHGTGAVDIHGITPDMLRDAPTWAAVAPELANRLHGRTLLAHNAQFETGWLSHHLPLVGQPSHPHTSTFDTLAYSRQHRGTAEKHTLSALCADMNVSYDNGHRAEHDTAAAAEAFFALRNRSRTAFNAGPFANDPVPNLTEARESLTKKRGHISRLTTPDLTAAGIDRWGSAPPAAHRL